MHQPQYNNNLTPCPNRYRLVISVYTTRTQHCGTAVSSRKRSPRTIHNTNTHTHTHSVFCVCMYSAQKREKTREAADRSLEVFSLVVILFFSIFLSLFLSSRPILYSSLIFIMTPRQTRCAPFSHQHSKKTETGGEREEKKKKKSPLIRLNCLEP